MVFDCWFAQVRLSNKSVTFGDRDANTSQVCGTRSNDFMVVFFVTGFITWLNVGISNDFVVRWLRGWLLGWPIAALAVITLAPLGELITRLIVRKLS